MTASEKVAYLKGLADGLGVSDSTNDGKLMLAVIDVLETLAMDVESVDAHAQDLSDSISDISRDMEYLEDAYYGDEADAAEDDDNDTASCASCRGCSTLVASSDDLDLDEFDADADDDVPAPADDDVPAAADDDDDEDEDDEQEYEVTCPKCGETITVYEEDLAFGSIRCPKCDAELEFDTDDDK